MSPESSACTSIFSEDLTSLQMAAKNGMTKVISPAFVSRKSMRDFMDITKALADENRVRLLLALRQKELCLCQLIELVQLAPSTVSKHMSILKQARLVDSRKDGRWMYYRLAGRDSPETVRKAIQWVSKSLENDIRVSMDIERLDEILRIDQQKLCESVSLQKHKCSNPGQTKNTRHKQFS
jgi:ArsR family transcriptional regulator, arsenate/arsenite/antimonite-responsive transcriptional repressor